MPTTQFPITGNPDQPLIIDANYRQTNADRAYIDGQIIGVQVVVQTRLVPAYHKWSDLLLDNVAGLQLVGQQNMLVDCSGFLATRTMFMPVSPLLMQCITFKFTDNSLATYNAIISAAVGSGIQVQGFSSAPALSYAMTGATWGNSYGSATFCFNGSNVWETI